MKTPTNPLAADIAAAISTGAFAAYIAAMRPTTAQLEAFLAYLERKQKREQ